MTRQLLPCRSWLCLMLASVFAATGSAVVFGAERGLSSYLPAYYGDYAVAVAPAPGLYGYATSYNFFAKQAPAGFGGELKLLATAGITGFQFVAAEKLWHATIAAGAYTAFIDATLSGSITSGATKLSFNQHKAELGDTSISPIALYWTAGNWHLSVYEAIFLPTGRFKRGDALNLSRNYFSFDTVAAVTWLDRSQGLEISVVPGVMINTENTATKYLTGTEFHIDGMANKYLTATLAVGLHSYLYTQLNDDQLQGQDIQGSRSFSVGVGPSLLWIPQSPDFSGKVVIKWLHEFVADDRFAGDIVSITAALKF